MKNLITRTITGIIFISLIIGSLFLKSYFFCTLFLFFTMVGTWEMIQLIKQSGDTSQQYLPYFLSATLFLSFTASFYIGLIFILSVLAVFIAELFIKRENHKPITVIALSIIPSVWIAFPLGITGLWAFHYEMQPMVLALFIILWASDTFAYCAGSLFGRHPLFKRISPKKTWEGSVISLLITCGVATSFHFIPYFGNNCFSSIAEWVGFALVIIVFGTLGDLTESLFKRSCCVKDSGFILPGHGGILDRFDSLFFAAPAAFIYTLLVTL